MVSEKLTDALAVALVAVLALTILGTVKDGGGETNAAGAVVYAGASCAEESYRCLGDYTQVCHKEQWINEEKCPAGCSNGQCLRGTQCMEGEYRCLNEYMQSCVYGAWFNKARCKEGCKNAACVEYVKERTCTDSDNGKNFLVAGNAYGVDIHNAHFSKIDYCLTEQDLVEYSCTQGYLFEDKYLCSGVCKDGACVEEEKEEEIKEEMAEEPAVTEQPAHVPAPEPAVSILKTEGWFARLWAWIKGIFTR
ncbi:hypothetical protein HY488_01855 [Candidatus Woesearchaeota archaeon]|nr:hypothetical protein [Candidatus Woesearchaeota archaeon]